MLHRFQTRQQHAIKAQSGQRLLAGNGVVISRNYLTHKGGDATAWTIQANTSPIWLKATQPLKTISRLEGLSVSCRALGQDRRQLRIHRVEERTRDGDISIRSSNNPHNDLAICSCEIGLKHHVLWIERHFSSP